MVNARLVLWQQLDVPIEIVAPGLVQVVRRKGPAVEAELVRRRYRRPHPAPELTFDHVVPRSRGGRTAWSNIVTACTRCNLRKGNKTMAEASMYPAQMPFQPSVHHLHRNGRLFPPNYLHDSWLDYLYWDTELDP